MKGVISGSFRKFYREICKAYDIFEKNGIAILSPKKSRIINPGDDFVILESDPTDLSIREIEDRHLEAIEESDFLYVVNPNGYIGDTVKFELGYSHRANKLIYSMCPFEDVLLGKYIKDVFSPEKLCDFLK